MAIPRPTALIDLKDSALKGYEIAEASLCDMVNIQAQPGNCYISEYMVGLYNGLEMALAIVQGREPEYRSTLDCNEITPAYMAIGQPETAATEEPPQPIYYPNLQTMPTNYETLRTRAKENEGKPDAAK